MRYSAGASNNILGPGNGAMANAVAHYGGTGHLGGNHLWPGRHDQTTPFNQPHLWVEDGVGTEVPVQEIPQKIFDHNINFPQSSGMYNNGFLAGGPELFPIPGDINAGEVRGKIEGVQGGARNDISRPFGGLQGNPRQPRLQAQMNLPGKQGIPQVAGQFMTPGFKQEIPQISTGPYTGGAVGAPIGTYKGGSFAVPLPYYG